MSHTQYAHTLSISDCVSVCGLESARLSLRPGVGGSSRRLNAEMIGRPENDLRHVGHVGYDGVTFGDVAFIGSATTDSDFKPHNNAHGGRPRESCCILSLSHTPSVCFSHESVFTGDAKKTDSYQFAKPCRFTLLILSCK